MGHPRVLTLIMSAVIISSLAASAVRAEVVTRGPYLQSATDTSIVVRWSTDQPTDTRVVYGSRADALNSTVEDLLLTTDHLVTLTGLKPDAVHHYRVGTTASLLLDAEGEPAGGRFVTAPPADLAKPTRIWVLGDSGQGNIPVQQVRDAYLAFTGDRGTDLWLMLGDNAYSQGTDQQYQDKLFAIFPETLREAALWPTLGNHDLYDATNQTWPYFDIFVLPENGEAGGVASGTEAYYSFDHGNIHFVVLDTITLPYDPMLAWLEDDLAATTKRWIVVATHIPPYSKGSHDSDDPSDSNGRLVEVREQVVPILESHGVDLMLAGHSHSYERSFLIHGHYGDSTTWVEAYKIDGGDGLDAAQEGDGAYQAEGDGAVYSIVGSSSIKSGGTFDHPAMYFGENELGSLVLDVGGNRLDATFLDETGEVLDRYTLVKGGCDDDGQCEAGEDCFVCPGDCASVSGASCGNGVCEILAGEDCASCAADCRGRQNGQGSHRYCCGDGDGEGPVSVTDPRCSRGGFWISDSPPTDACCGDSVCTGAEDGTLCALDCGDSPPSCLPLGASCSTGADCCSNKCKGKAGAKTCR